MVLFKRYWVLGVLLALITNLRGPLMYETPTGFSLWLLVSGLGQSYQVIF